MNPARRLRRQRGQSMVVVALMIVVLIGMVAVTVDGGYGYMRRRAAQVAADAGALAGARELCLTGDVHLAIDRALEYAITRNFAQEADVTIDSGVVTVVTRNPFASFFGRIFGQPELVPGAVAAAECFSPSAATGILPIAWNCKPPVYSTASDDCEILYGPDNLYIIMDSKSATEDFTCQDPPNSGEPPGAMDCDYDDDGINDVLAAGDRSWLDLDGGGGGSSELVNWINGGFTGTVREHTWYGGQTGVDNNVFQAAAARRGDVVIVPVFDIFCNIAALPEIGCPALYHPEDITVPSGGAATLYYHVVTFALFKITCVHAPPFPHGPCPGHDAAGLPVSVKSIEGYFVPGTISGLMGRGSVDAGAFTVVLTQ